MTGSGLLGRWVRFNGVGALGVAVQLAALAWLVRRGGMHYLWATAIAVEAAVLHNFVLHERWTWRDRRAPSGSSLLARLARFHLLNGSISIVGNLTLMHVLTGSMRIDPIAANIVSVLACSAANFAAGEFLVFTRVAVMAAALLLAAPLAPPARAESPGGADLAGIELRARTLAAWTTYERGVGSRFDAGSATASPFFALDAFGATDWRRDALGGGIAMLRADRPSPAAGSIDVPDGRIHHWIGAVFVPGTTVAGVVRRLSELAGHESAHYRDVVSSRLLAREGDRYRIFLKLRRSKVITVTYNTEHAVEYRQFGSARAAARSLSTRIAELEHADTPQEREKPIGADGGYLWRLNAYWRYEAVKDGVLIECESLSLSRDVPVMLRPFVSGIVEGLARESLERTLTELRTALVKGT